MKGYVYILECGDGSYYTGSTRDIEKRLWEHQNYQGANYTKKKQPVRLVFCEEFKRIDEAFAREKQIQGWSHAKKKALIEGKYNMLPELSKNYTQYPRETASTSSLTGPDPSTYLDKLDNRSGTGDINAFPEPVEGNMKKKGPELVETTDEKGKLG